MRRPHFSISSLMVAVLVVAVGLAMAVFAANLQLSAMHVLNVGVLTVATLGILRRGRRRAFCSGFAVVGWSYFLLSTFAMGLPPTTMLLLRIYEITHAMPVPTKPEDMLTWLMEVGTYVMVGHAVLTPLFALAGGLMVWLIAIGSSRWFRRGITSPVSYSNPSI